MITDTHAHLFWDSFKEDFDEVIKRAIDAKVITIVNVGTDLETSQEALDQIYGKLANFPELAVYSSIGIHPHEALRYAQAFGSETQARRGKQSDAEEAIQKDIEELEEIYKSNSKKVTAIGECGLDFNFNNRDFMLASRSGPSDLSIDEVKNLQKLLLKAQVDLAKTLNLPLLVHTRDAWEEIFDFISDHFGILHCFSGDLEILEKAIKTNFLISFSGTITYPKNDTLREVVRQTPLEKIVLETDCPFLPPQSKRGTRNEPANIKEVAEEVAKLKNLPLEEVVHQISKNTANLFNTF